MDVTKILEADHREVEALFEKISRAKGAQRQPLIDRLATSLKAHMELEEQVVYPAMRPVTGEEPVQEALTEHKLGRKGLQDVLDLAPDSPGFGAALDAAKAGIAHHVHEEETQIFPKLRRQGTAQLKSMATPFMQKRVQLGMPMEPAALEAASSKGELVEEATSAGIDHASSMTKSALASALAERMKQPA